MSPSTGQVPVRGDQMMNPLTKELNRPPLSPVGRSSLVGSPSGERPTGDNGGRFNSFVNGFIIWSPRTGTWPVLGDIARRYDSLGREMSALGYPTSGEFAVPGGRRSNFEHGSITWSSTTGALTVRIT